MKTAPLRIAPLRIAPLRVALLTAGVLITPLLVTARAVDLSGVWKIATPITALRTVDGTVPPVTPAALATYNAHKAAKSRGDLSWDTAQICKPPGEPRTMFESAWPFEIVQTGNRVEFLYQWNHLTRLVPIQNHQDTFTGPWYYGQSVGHFEGQTFVVDDVGVSGDTSLDSDGLPHSDSIDLTERFTLQDGGKTLEARIHIVDPATFTKPWDTILRFTRQPLGSITEDVCETRLHQESRYPVLPEKLYPQ